MSLQSIPSKTGLFQICRHDGKDVDPDRRDAVDATDDAAILKTFISKFFPGVEPDPSIVETCIYTVRKRLKIK